MAGKIFINYRRGDDPGFTQALYMRLEDEFTADNLFMDVEGHIKPGDDFVEVLNAQVAASDILLVVIGPRWAELMAARQSDPEDFVAIEIRAGLDNGKRVVPVLVGGADMPRADLLPEPIRALARRNAVGLRPERFRADCQGLITALTEQLAAAEKERTAQTEAERAAAEAERLKREAEEAARIAAAEQRAQAQTMAGLSPDEVRKAEELANWDFVKDRDDVQDLRDHLARFPGGTTERYALSKLEQLVWAGLGPQPGIPALDDFLQEFPKGLNADTARARLADLLRLAAEARDAEQRRARETEEWGAVAASTEAGQITEFLQRWPKGQHAAAARGRLDELRRGTGGERRGILIGAGATAGLVALLAGGWWSYAQWRWHQSLKDPSVQVVDFDAQRAKPGRAFKECDHCPQMIVVPAGSFTMGSPVREAQRSSDETQLKVTIRQPFAVGKFEVTFDEWDACVTAGACNGYSPSDVGWGRGTRPVINVSWSDAKAYVAWLAAKTGKPYRLLSEAEWEYVARAGTSTAYHWGSKFDSSKANTGGNTVPVGQYGANPWGLHDVHGNVWEWTEDCSNDSNKGNPGDGSARTTGDCSRRVVRGGSWISIPQGLRSAGRSRFTTDFRNYFLGFRVARTLNP